MLVAVIQGMAYATPPRSDERMFFWSFAVDDPVTALTLHPLEWVMTPFGILGVGSAMLVGIWAARRGVLSDPGLHRALLVRTAAIGLPLAVAGGLPMGLAAGGFWTPASPAVLWAVSALHSVTGVAGGLGYAALIGLLAARIQHRRGHVVRAIAVLFVPMCYVMAFVALPGRLAYVGVVLANAPWLMPPGTHLRETLVNIAAVTPFAALIGWAVRGMEREAIRRREANSRLVAMAEENTKLQACCWSGRRRPEWPRNAPGSPARSTTPSRRG